MNNRITAWQGIAVAVSLFASQPAFAREAQEFALDASSGDQLLSYLDEKCKVSVSAADKHRTYTCKGFNATVRDTPDSTTVYIDALGNAGRETHVPFDRDMKEGDSLVVPPVARPVYRA